MPVPDKPDGYSITKNKKYTVSYCGFFTLKDPMIKNNKKAKVM